MVNKPLKHLIFLITLGFQLSLPGQNRQAIDSLKLQISTCRIDTQKVNILNALSSEYTYIAPVSDSALYYSNQALTLSQKSRYKMGLSNSYRCKGDYYEATSDYALAIEYYKKALEVDNEIKRKDRILKDYQRISKIYRTQHNSVKMIEYLFKALEIAEQLNDHAELAGIYNEIGVNYVIREHYHEAIKFFKEVIKVTKETKGSNLHAMATGNIAIVYIFLAENALEKGEITKADEYITLAKKGYTEAAKLYQLAHEADGIPSLDLYFAQLDLLQKNYLDAIQKYDNCIHWYSGDENNVRNNLKLSECFVGKGKALTRLGKYNEALKYFNMEEARTVTNSYIIKNRYSGLSEAYEKMGKTKEALVYYKLFTQLRDSIMGGRTSTEFAMLENQIQNAKEHEIASLKEAREKEINKAEREKQKLIIVSLGFGLVLVFIFAGFIFRSLKRTKKQKQLIEEQKKEVSAQKELVEEKQKEIIDSIHYAQRIQRALITPERYIDKNLNKLQDKS